MTHYMQTLIPLLSSIALILALVNTARSQSESTSFTYDFYGDKPSSLSYQGDAHFPSDTTYLRLTKTDASGTPQAYSIGRVVYSSPVVFQAGSAQADFETTLKFVITPGETNSGDGLAFFIAPVGYEIPSGSTGGNFGVFNPSGSSPSVFAVEFDTVTNGWDPSYRHVGIDIESHTSSNLTSVGDAIIGQEVTARVNYVGATNLISVNVNAGSQNFEVTYAYDLSTVLPSEVQVGISAATGALVSLHDVVSWYFTSTIVQTGDAAEGEGAKIRQIV